MDDFNISSYIHTLSKHNTTVSSMLQQMAVLSWFHEYLERQRLDHCLSFSGGGGGILLCRLATGSSTLIDKHLTKYKHSHSAVKHPVHDNSYVDKCANITMIPIWPGNSPLT